MTHNSLVRVTSWNLAGMEPYSGPMLDELFNDTSRLPNVRPDIQIVGLQEAPSFLLRDPWTENLSSSLHKRGYILFKRHSLSGIFLYIFVLKEILLRCRDFETESVRTYLLKSKGGVSLRFNYNGFDFCITNAHLAAHQENLKDRISDYGVILQNTKFLINSTTPSILDYDYSIWFGDLNFRFDDIATDRVLSIIDEYRTSGNSSILSRLYKHDQLIKTREKKLAFAEFNETLPKFAPTYKFKIGTKDEYDSSQRIPAWTDRILYRTKERKSVANSTADDKLTKTLEGRPKIEQLYYECLPNFNISDHKPVVSLFKVTTHSPTVLDSDSTRLPYEVVKFEPIVGWRAGHDGRLWYKISDDLFNRDTPVLSSWDRVALYKSDFVSLDTYLTFIYPPSIARVAPRLDAPTVPYLRSPNGSRSSSQMGSRRNSTSSITQATEAISLNSLEDISTNITSRTPLQNTSSQSTVTSSSNATVATSRRPPSQQVMSSTSGPIVEDGFKYFSVQFPDEILIPGSYVVLYLKVTEANEYNVYGISKPFIVSNN